MKAGGSLLVTGAGGFIGRQIVECYRAHHPEADIIGIDRVSFKNEAANYCLLSDLLEGKKSGIAEIILRYNIGAIFHCAGSMGTEPESLIGDNLLATTMLLETVSEVKAGVPFCYLGSSAEYRPLNRPHKTSEETPTEPISDYGKVKLQTTKAVIDAAYKGIVRSYVLRLFNPIGIGMNKLTLVGRICQFVQNDKEGNLILGGLDSYRDFIDVRDVARAVVVSLHHVENLVGEVVNIGTGIAHRTKDLVYGLIKCCPGSVHIEEDCIGSSRSSTVIWQEADVLKAMRLLKWRDFLFEQTIEHIAKTILL